MPLTGPSSSRISPAGPATGGWPCVGHQPFPFPVTAPFRVAPDLVRLEGPLLVADEHYPHAARLKLAHLDHPARPLAACWDAEGIALRVVSAIWQAATRLAEAHPDLLARSPDAASAEPAEELRILRAGLALRRADQAVRALCAQAEPLAQRLAGFDPARRCLAALSLGLQEDLVLMGRDGVADDDLRALALSVVFPSGWDPLTRLGLPLRAIHGPVADGERLRQASSALSQAMLAKGPFLRFIWTLAPDDRLARWPGEGEPLDPAGPVAGLWLRCERQVTLPLPAFEASLFLIRVMNAPLATMAHDATRRALLVASLRSMSDAVVAYKGIGAARERVLAAWG